MFDDKNFASISESLRASAPFLEQQFRSLDNSCSLSFLQDQGMNIGLELESKKAQKNKIINPSADGHEEEEKSTRTPSTVKSTPKSENLSEKLGTPKEKSLLGKRKLVPLIEGCNDIENYELLNYIHEGVYGMVYRAKDKYTGKVYAIKKIKLTHEKEGFPISSLREINLLKSLKHPNIVNIREVVMGKSFDQVFVVMEYAENELRDLIQHYNYRFSIPEIKGLMKQLLQAMAYLHNQNIVHRDLKTSNLLYTHKGLLKVCDFGLSRKMTSSKRSYTPIVVTLTYRSPELLLGCTTYTSALDMWSVGCIFAELLLKKPLFRGKTEAEQLDLIFKTLGTPTTKEWPGWRELKLSKYFEGRNYPTTKLSTVLAPSLILEGIDLSEKGADLLQRLLTYDPAKRISAAEALKHCWFSEEPKPKEPEDMPIFAATNEVPRQNAKKIFVDDKKAVNI